MLRTNWRIHPQDSCAVVLCPSHCDDNRGGQRTLRNKDWEKCIRIAMSCQVIQHPASARWCWPNVLVQRQLEGTRDEDRGFRCLTPERALELLTILNSNPKVELPRTSRKMNPEVARGRRTVGRISVKGR